MGVAIKTALNFSPAAKVLLADGAIAFDLWKSAPYGPWREEARSSRPPLPLYLHFPLDVGELDFADKTNWEEIERQLGETGTPFVNVHLNARREHFPEAASPEQERFLVRERFLRNLGLVSERFAPERIIAENVIYRGPEGPYLLASVEPEVISGVIEETGCGLLLNTAHARITCDYLGMPVKTYIEALPVQRLRELHITGTQHDGNRLRDSMPMSDADWTTARWVMERIKAENYPRPWVVALEYGGIGPGYEWRSDPRVITEELPALSALCAG